MKTLYSRKQLQLNKNLGTDFNLNYSYVFLLLTHAYRIFQIFSKKQQEIAIAECTMRYIRVVGSVDILKTGIFSVM